MSVCAGTPDCSPRTRPHLPMTAGPFAEDIGLGAADERVSHYSWLSAR
jgi:hypothetical protein